MNTKRTKYRYILSGSIGYNKPISNYRLIASNMLSNHEKQAIRITIPDDMKLKKYSCDSYSTTDDNRKLSELTTNVVVKLNGIYRIMNDLKQYQPHEFHEILRNEYAYYLTYTTYTTKDKFEYYQQIGFELIRDEREKNEKRCNNLCT